MNHFVFVHPQPRPFTLLLFLDFRAIFFPEWPLICWIITIHQVIWPSPGTLGTVKVGCFWSNLRIRWNPIYKAFHRIRLQSISSNSSLWKWTNCSVLIQTWSLLAGKGLRTCVTTIQVQPFPWKMGLEMLNEMVIEILNGGEILVNCKFKLNKKFNLNLYCEIPRTSNPIKISIRLCTVRYWNIWFSRFWLVDWNLPSIQDFDYHLIQHFESFHGTGCSILFFRTNLVMPGVAVVKRVVQRAQSARSPEDDERLEMVEFKTKSSKVKVEMSFQMSRTTYDE